MNVSPISATKNNTNFRMNLKIHKEFRNVWEQTVLKTLGSDEYKGLAKKITELQIRKLRKDLKPLKPFDAEFRLIADKLIGLTMSIASVKTNDKRLPEIKCFRKIKLQNLLNMAKELTTKATNGRY